MVVDPRIKRLKMIKVLIVDDHNLVIEGILSLLKSDQEIEIIGSVLDGKTCIEFLEKFATDVLLLDINLPDINGLDLCKQLKNKKHNLKIIALSTYNQSTFINKMLANGADGYLLKNVGKAELSVAIKKVYAGETVLSEEVSKIIKISKTKLEAIPILTKRETEVLKLISEGWTNQQIGEKLFISIDTVDSHRKNLHTKLSVNNTALLVRFALENGMI
jgi:DNA-binding NarL/FixJ family response regulator